VYGDLRPYICMHKDCQSQDVLFESKHDWCDHELHTHPKEWRCGTCPRPFASASEFKEHLLTVHKDIAGTDALEAMVEICGQAEAPPEACEFCGETVALAIRRKHLSRHMQGFALLALPEIGYEDRELEKGQMLEVQNTNTDAQLQMRNSEGTSPPEPKPDPARESGLSPVLSVLGPVLDLKQPDDDESPSLHAPSMGSFRAPSMGLLEQLEQLERERINRCERINRLKSAAERGHLQHVMAICTRYQGLLNAEDADGYTPLHHASRCGHADVVNFLLSCGSHVDKQSHITGHTPLMQAAEYGHLKVIRLLLEGGANPKMRNNKGADVLRCIQYSPNSTLIEGEIMDAVRARSQGNRLNAINDHLEKVNRYTYYGETSPNEQKSVQKSGGAFTPAEDVILSRFLTEHEDDPDAYLCRINEGPVSGHVGHRSRRRSDGSDDIIGGGAVHPHILDRINAINF